MLTKVWIVWYETRPIGSKVPFTPTRITVVGGGPDDAWNEAATELGQERELGFPVSAEVIAG